MMRVNSSNQTQAILNVMVCAMCLFATIAQAETIYRSIGTDGEITYSAQPVPGARESTALKMESLTPEQRRAGLLLRRQEIGIAAGVDAQLQARENEWKLADREITSAQQALAAAETALQNGRTPLGGERRADVGGGTRLTEDYFLRLRNLELQVEQAKARLDQAYTARNSLK
ncbi:MAG: DUF4124 domain-containing protein [Gallionella sp.]|jgi:hypothetical protein|nr:DUF4124 domain-containing protein [Gallionella sp.]